MSITWGRRPDPLAPTGAWRLPFALALTIASVASAFAPAEPPPPPNAITAETRGEIQALLDLHLDRLEQGDLAGYRLTIDPTRTAFAACLERAFAEGPGRAAELRPFRLLTLEPHLNTYLRAVVRQRDGVFEWTLRRAGVSWNVVKPPFYIWRESWRWYVSEPGPTERPAAGLRLDGATVPPLACGSRSG